MTSDQAKEYLQQIKLSYCTAWELAFLKRVEGYIARQEELPARMTVTFGEIVRQRAETAAAKLLMTD